jgi:hypothetical protein
MKTSPFVSSLKVGKMQRPRVKNLGESIYLLKIRTDGNKLYKHSRCDYSLAVDNHEVYTVSTYKLWITAIAIRRSVGVGNVLGIICLVTLRICDIIAFTAKLWAIDI